MRMRRARVPAGRSRHHARGASSLEPDGVDAVYGRPPARSRAGGLDCEPAARGGGAVGAGMCRRGGRAAAQTRNRAGAGAPADVVERQPHHEDAAHHAMSLLVSMGKVSQALRSFNGSARAFGKSTEASPSHCAAWRPISAWPGSSLTPRSATVARTGGSASGCRGAVRGGEGLCASSRPHWQRARARAAGLPSRADVEFLASRRPSELRHAPIAACILRFWIPGIPEHSSLSFG